MTGIDDAAAELASLWPALAAALERDTAGDGTAAGTAVSMTVVNPDVLAAMLTLGREVPAAARRAAELTGERYLSRPMTRHLRHISRLHDRLRDTGREDAAAELARQAAGWLRMVKRALGLRKPDVPVGYACPYADSAPQDHAHAAMLFLAGAEGFLHPGAQVPVEWVTSGLIYCKSADCGASWEKAQWELLGKLLRQAAEVA